MLTTTKTATELWQEFAAGDAGRAAELTYTPLPDGLYEPYALDSLGIRNPKKFILSGSQVWAPVGSRDTLKRLNFSILKDSPDCIFVFLRIPRGMSFRIMGRSHRVLCLSSASMSASFTMITEDADPSKGSRAVIGERGFIGGARIVLKNTDLIIKKGTLWSDEILVQGSNQHGIVDIKAGKIIRETRNLITVGERAWIGRRAILMSGAEIGTGAIVATGALVANRVPPISIVAGNPAKVIKNYRSWTNHPSVMTEGERKFIHEFQEKLPIHPKGFARRLLKYATVGKIWALSVSIAAGFFGAWLVAVLEL